MKQRTKDRLIAALEKNPSLKNDVLEHFLSPTLVKLLEHPEARQMLLMEADAIYGGMAEEISPGDPWNEWVMAGGKRPPATKTCGPWVEIRGADGEVIHWAREGYKGETIAEVLDEGQKGMYSGKHMPDWTWTAHMLDPSDAPKVDIGYDGPEEEYKIGSGKDRQDAMNKADEQLKKWGWVFKDAAEWTPRGEWFMGRSGGVPRNHGMVSKVPTMKRLGGEPTDLETLEQRIMARESRSANPVLTPPRPDSVAGPWKTSALVPGKTCWVLPGTNTQTLASVVETVNPKGLGLLWHWKTVGGFQGYCPTCKEAQDKVIQVMQGFGYY